LEKDYYHTVLWMHEAINRLDSDEVFYAAILDYLAYATYMVCCMVVMCAMNAVEYCRLLMMVINNN